MALHVPDLLVNKNELFAMTVFAELKRPIEIQNSTAFRVHATGHSSRKYDHFEYCPIKAHDDQIWVFH